MCKLLELVESSSDDIWERKKHISIWIQVLILLQLYGLNINWKFHNYENCYS